MSAKDVEELNDHLEDEEEVSLDDELPLDALEDESEEELEHDPLEDEDEGVALDADDEEDDDDGRVSLNADEDEEDEDDDESEDEEDDDDEDDDESEEAAPAARRRGGAEPASLDEILDKKPSSRKASNAEDEDIMSLVSGGDEVISERLPSRVVPVRDREEFICKSCFLVKSKTQLADKKRQLCRDCA